MNALLRTAEIEKALAGLFPADVAVAVEPILESSTAKLWPGEAKAVAGAVPGRIAEFVAGRTAARRALQALGRPPASIPSDPDRAPVWPQGIGGSIAHNKTLAVAVVRIGAPLGVDIEEDVALESDLWPVICSPEDLATLPEVDRGRYVRHVFSAKEAAYKAQFPITSSLFGFGTLAIRLRGESFVARFRHPVGSIETGHEMHGRIGVAQGLVITGVAM